MTMFFRGAPPGWGAQTMRRREESPVVPDDWRMAEPAAPTGPEAIEGDWRTWHRAIWPEHDPDDFAPYHCELWDWAWSVTADASPPPFAAVWARGWAKSTMASRIVAMWLATGKRRYVLYVSGTQPQADDHVGNVAAHLEAPIMARYYPEIGERLLGKYSRSKGWRANRVRSATGATADAVGLEKAMRGRLLDSDTDRPDGMVFDDVDSEDDGQTVLDRKSNAVRLKILPAGVTANTTVMVVQNLVHPNGIVSQLVDGRADYLSQRIISGPHPAILDLVYEGVGKDARLISGTPTWAAKGLAECQAIVALTGIRSFLAESQHDVAQVGTPRFDREAIRVQAAGCRPPLPQAALPDDLRGIAGLSVWSLPRPGAPYVLYCDPAEGKGRDYTTTVVIEARTLAHVCTLRDNSREPSQHATIAVGLGRWYNGAYAGWESNKGEQVSYVFGSEAYSRLYWYTPEASLQQRMAGATPARHLGFPVTGATRPGLIEDLAVAIETYALTSYDEEVWKECAAFILTAAGRAEAAAGSHDDLVMALAGAVRVSREPGAQGLVSQVRERKRIGWVQRER